MYFLHYPNWTLLSFTSTQNQFSCQDPSFSMEDMLAAVPRVISGPPVSGSCLAPQELASGGKIVGGFGRGSQDDPRCNGTLRKQASPRSSTLEAGSTLTTVQGKVEWHLKAAVMGLNSIEGLWKILWVAHTSKLWTNIKHRVIMFCVFVNITKLYMNKLKLNDIS